MCNSISTSYEEDAYQGGGVTIHVPARTFFDKEALRWDGLSGYRGTDGKLQFLDPSVSSPGASALLVNRAYLIEFLRRHGFAIVWAVVGEKIYVGGHAGGSPRLEFSRAHLLDESGHLTSSPLIAKEG